MNLYAPTISGSLLVSGSVTVQGSISVSSGSVSGTASFASNSGLLNGLDSSSFTSTGSFNTVSQSLSTRVTKIEGNYATTGSNVFTANQTVCANITATGTIVAQTLNVQQVTSSIVYSSGSNIFGNLQSDVQQMTGSVRITGSLNTVGNACMTSICSPTFVGGTVSGTTVYGSTVICGAVICSTGNGLFGGSTNAGNAGTNTLSVGVPGTTAGGIQLWAATNQTHFLQFGDGTASADNYRGYISYAHGTDTLALGTSSTDRLTISSTGAATFSSSVTATGTITMNKTGGYGFLAQDDGNNTAANGAYFGFVNAAANRYFIHQLDTSNNIRYHYFNGTTWSPNIIQFTNAGAATFSSTVTACGNITASLSNPTFLATDGTNNSYFATVTTNNGYANGTSAGDAIIRGTSGISLSSNGGTSVAMRITSGGSVGIGTASPSALLDICKCAANNVNIYNTNSYLNQGNLIRFQQNTTNGVVCAFLGHAGDATGDFTIFNGGIQRASISCQGIACFACQVCAPLLTSYKRLGRPYSQTSSSGGTSIIDTSINVSDFGDGSLWSIAWGGNPNAAGSSYFSSKFGYIGIITGYNGNVVKSISYTQVANFENVGTLCLFPLFWDGSTECTTVCQAYTGCIRFKICGYNSGYPAANQQVYLTKLLG